MENVDEQFLYFDMVSIGLIILTHDYKIINVNEFALEKLYCDRSEVVNRSWEDVFPNLLKEELKNKELEIFQFTFADESFIAQKWPCKVGFVIVFQPKSTLEEMTKELDSYQNLNFDLKAIFDISYDVIYVSDGNGKTLRVSAACERLWGLKESDLVGKTVYQLEAEGVFNPSITRLVLEKKEKVSFIQTTRTGRRLMVVGTPIKDEEGTIIRVVNASRDVTEVKQLETELDLLKQMTEGYREEIQGLRAKNEVESKIISRSEKMKKIVNFSQKIAKVDSTVLLLGETGVGKEVMASFIHTWSSRRENPFITVNCGSMPEKLLEVELFGHEDKMGSIEMANTGTLFLDEVDQIPMSLQVKLLRVLQKKTNDRKTANLRLIAASNVDLSRKVKEGQLREDLFYILNVIPIELPPLRERKEDIIPLIIHFTDQLNRKYQDQKKFQPLLLKKLQEYAWPGNVQELHNIIERMFVTSDGTWIELSQLPEHIGLSQSNEQSIKVNKIMPLKDAVEILEKELLNMAEKKYGSTTKIAEVLGVNQSTISRKIQRYRSH